MLRPWYVSASYFDNNDVEKAAIFQAHTSMNLFLAPLNMPQFISFLILISIYSVWIKFYIV